MAILIKNSIISRKEKNNLNTLNKNRYSRTSAEFRYNYGGNTSEVTHRKLCEYQCYHHPTNRPSRMNHPIQTSHPIQSTPSLLFCLLRIPYPIHYPSRCRNQCRSPDRSFPGCRRGIPACLLSSPRSRTLRRHRPQGQLPHGCRNSSLSKRNNT